MANSEVMSQAINPAVNPIEIDNRFVLNLCDFH